MKFNITELRKIISSIKKHNIENINIKSNFFKLTINRYTQKNTDTKEIKPLPIKSKKQNKPTINTNYSTNIEKASKYNHSEEDIYFTIISPMIGTFYRSPGPNEPPFIQINDIVKSNQTVCIIEAMKLMNEIEAEVNGIVVDILVQDGDIVDCGQALMKVKPAQN